MTDWTPEQVAARFSEAASTARALPPIPLQGYYNCWPQIQRASYEVLGAECRLTIPPPLPDAVDRMLETMQWARWLEEEQRHLVWMRAERYGWRKISQRFGCDRTTAWRRWQRALGAVAATLNQAPATGREKKYYGYLPRAANS